MFFVVFFLVVVNCAFTSLPWHAPYPGALAPAPCLWKKLRRLLVKPRKEEPSATNRSARSPAAHTLGFSGIPAQDELVKTGI